MSTPLNFSQRQKMNHLLQSAGLATLENAKELLAQVALGITDHYKFRSIIMKCEPERRRDCYESLKGFLRFEVKTLDQYETDARIEADVKQLPAVVDGKIVAYEDYNPTKKPLVRIAEEAIAARQREEAAKGLLELVCRRCTVAELFPAKSHKEALKLAEVKGWRPDGEKSDKALCPKCAPRPLNMKLSQRFSLQ